MEPIEAPRYALVSLVPSPLRFIVGGTVMCGQREEG
jgi:hypothetical protein